MKQKLAIILASVLVVLGLSWTAVAHADSNIQTGPSVLVPAGTALDQTVFAAGRTIDIAGVVNGDVFCAGQSVTISGEVNGDVICASQDLHVSGIVNGNVRAVGQTITIDAHVARNVSALGQSIAFDNAAKIDGDASAAGQDVTVDGTVARDLMASATTLTVNGHIGRDVQAQTTRLALGGQAVVGRNVTYASFNTLSRPSGATVNGTVTKQQPVNRRREGANPVSLAAWGFTVALYLFVALLLVSLVLILLFPSYIHKATEAMVRDPLTTFVVGLIASILVPIAIGLLMVSVIGIPLGLLALLVWLLMMFLAVPLAAYYLGSLILSKSTNNPVWMMLLGAAIVLILYLIPIVGFAVWLVAEWIGLGIILMQVPRLPRPHYEVK